MKSKVWLIIMLLVGCVMGIKISGEEKPAELNVISTNIDDYFKGLDDTDKVLPLPNGGYLHGSATLTYEDGTTVELNSETDPNSLTIASIKENANK